MWPGFEVIDGWRERRATREARPLRKRRMESSAGDATRQGGSACRETDVAWRLLHGSASGHPAVAHEAHIDPAAATRAFTTAGDCPPSPQNPDSRTSERVQTLALHDEQALIDREIFFSEVRWHRYSATTLRRVSALHCWVARQECAYSRYLCTEAASIRGNLSAHRSHG
jgi:hypothetical protein